MACLTGIHRHLGAEPARGTEQGGGPPWLRATPDPNNPIQPGQGRGAQSGQPTGPTLHFSGQVVSVVDNALTFADQNGV